MKSTSETKPEKPPANEREQPPARDAWRERLLWAKRHGAIDAVAAECAGLSIDDLEDHLENDPALDRDMRQARADALIQHIQSIRDASQWQAHEYLLEHLWPEQFGDKPPPAPESRQRQEIRQTISVLSASETREIIRILQLGIVAHRQQKSLPLECPNNTNP